MKKPKTKKAKTSTGGRTTRTATRRRATRKTKTSRRRTTRKGKATRTRKGTRKAKATRRRHTRTAARRRVKVTPIFQALDRELAAIARRAARAGGRSRAPVAAPAPMPDVSRELVALLKEPRVTKIDTSAGTPRLPMIVVEGVYSACAISPSDIVMVGQIFEKPGKPDQRVIGLRGGNECYVLDSRENLTRLLGPALAEELNTRYLQAKAAGEGKTDALAVTDQLKASVKAKDAAPAGSTK